MEQFEYLPQLIVAKDSIDKFANLIHISKSKSDETYYCPCCNGIVNRRALSSEKMQSHYYHLTGKCTKQEQIVWFCKNWLFTKGSKFYVENTLYEVLNIEIEPSIDTKFGKYKPSILVNVKSGETIYFELFFLNKKREHDYFCKWQELGKDVVNVNLKEFIYKDEDSAIPHFTYLYHNGKCYLKEYVKNDLYANTIGKLKGSKGIHNSKDVLKEKINIELLDEFWKRVQEKSTKKEILKIIETMTYDEIIICYEVIKRKECMKYLKDDVLKIIHNNSVEIIREKLGLPYNEQVYFDVRYLKGKTYELGIYTEYDSKSIHCNKILYVPSCEVVLRKNVHSVQSISNCIFFDSAKTDVCFDDYIMRKLLEAYNKSVNAITQFDNIQKNIDSLSDKYKISISNSYITVLAKVHDNNYEVIIKDKHIDNFDINYIVNLIEEKIEKIKKLDELNDILKSNELKNIINEVETYTDLFNVKLSGKIQSNEIVFILYMDEYCAYIKSDINNLKDNALKELDTFINIYYYIEPFLNKINSCKNKKWSAKLYIDTFGCMKMYITLYFTKKYNVSSYITIYNNCIDNFEKQLVCKMNEMVEYLEYKGLRIMEV